MEYLQHMMFQKYWKMFSFLSTVVCSKHKRDQFFLLKA